MKQKTVDAVKLMRDLRDQLSQKYVTMSIQEEMADLQKHFPHIRMENAEKRKETSGKHQMTSFFFVFSWEAGFRKASNGLLS